MHRLLRERRLAHPERTLRRRSHVAATIGAGLVSRGSVFGIPFGVGALLSLPNGKLSRIEGIATVDEGWVLDTSRPQVSFGAIGFGIEPVPRLTVGAALHVLAGVRGEFGVSGGLAQPNEYDSELRHDVDADLASARSFGIGLGLQVTDRTELALSYRHHARIEQKNCRRSGRRASARRPRRSRRSTRSKAWSRLRIIRAPSLSARAMTWAGSACSRRSAGRTSRSGPPPTAAARRGSRSAGSLPSSATTRTTDRGARTSRPLRAAARPRVPRARRHPCTSFGCAPATPSSARPSRGRRGHAGSTPIATSSPRGAGFETTFGAHALRIDAFGRFTLLSERDAVSESALGPALVASGTALRRRPDELVRVLTTTVEILARADHDHPQRQLAHANPASPARPVLKNQ